MSAADIDLATRLLVAVAIGLLIGLERGWQQREAKEGERVAGLRTFTLVALLGALTDILDADGVWLLASMALVLGALACAGYYAAARGQADRSITGAVALLVTFALGALASRGRLELSVALAVTVALLLGFKPELHGIVRAIDRRELLGTLRLLVISVVVLPVLPDRGYGPWQALNPYKIWWMVVLVASVSYAGYFAKRLCGSERGILLTGVLGGMVSSTAVTLALSRRAAAEAGRHDTFSAGIVVASSMMFLRVLVIIAPLAPRLVVPLAAPLGVAAVVGFVGAVILAWRMRRSGGESRKQGLELQNPLELSTALQFGALLGGVLVLSRALSDWYGDRGVYLLAASAGLADVDAIALSVATMSQQGAVTAATAVGGVVTAVAVNTLVKCGICFTLAGTELGLRVLTPLAAALAAAVATISATG